ncbi:uncharacterized protein LOC126788043 [Argentina anserina]|uniref:uncharacterized protein LOC126788043 n=1 Tax=Argentina anserina TaxID=57926 RepID=UPI002176703B|nr:uncharacterized protein LOC126788043 [Potentilla anserina]
MSGNEHCFVEWKEHFVSQERGNRVVHYFLKDSTGESIRAVIGTERSVRHMFYVVADEFLQVHGSETANTNYKWRSRREVVDWLTSMLSKQLSHGDLYESLEHDPSQGLGSPEYPNNGSSGPQIQVSKDSGHAKNFKMNSPDIVWSGVSWTCGKQLKHFPAFCRNGIKIEIKSFVFVMAKGENRYVAYMEDMYEDKRGQKKVKVRWFHRNQEVKGVIPLQNPHPKEVFITPYVQVISAECVDGPATVLTREHYEKCAFVFPQALLAKVHLCYRQFKSKRVKPFDLSKMHGYFIQPILSYLSPNFLPNSECMSDTLIGKEDKLGTSDYVKLGTKRTRNGRPCQRVPTNQNSSFGFLDKRLLSWNTPLFKVDEKIELLCQDSGIRGCWFRCTVLQTSRKHIRVRYNDLLDEEGCGNLEEWIPAFRLAKPDKIGMRHVGRSIIRPAPPEEQMGLPLEVGSAIDAWWSDGWWEGIITGFGSCDDNVQVYFPGESLVLNMDKKDLRISRDWLGDQWVDIEAKPDVLSAISSTISSCTRPFVSSNIAKVVEDVGCGGNTLSCPELPSSSRREKEELCALPSCDRLPDEMDLVNDKKPPSIKEIGPSSSRLEKDESGAFPSCDHLPDKMDLVNDKKSPSIRTIGTEGVDGNDKSGDIIVVQGNDHYDAKDDLNGVNEGQECMEVVENPRKSPNVVDPGKSPKAVEFMEVTS